MQLPAALDAKLEAVAHSRLTSKNAVLIEAIERFISDNEAKTAAVLSTSDEISTRYAELMERLKDA
ncbi:hypothetical protein [Microbacterium sp.]|uniref:hypothetical protein n=1 Tax=Microbacterium sp. TaxID=51671 RepID=UPI003F957EDD